MTVGLALIVKDEAAVIERCLASVRDHIDHWVILDTGSTDGTPELIEQALAGVPGALHHGVFNGFGQTRSELMELARGTADYLLLLDADMQVRWPKVMPELTADVYDGRILTGPQHYALPILVRGDREWRYEGVAHSYLACDGPHTTLPLPGLEIIDGSHTTRAKLERDLGLLSAEHARHPLDARTAFYLAQTYYDLDMIPEAIAAYRYRANLAGWDEETFFARYRLGALLCEHVSFSEGADELLAAWRMRPGRAEPLRCLANVAGNVADKIPATSDRLFVTTAAYTKPGGLSPADVSAVIVTRGHVDLDPILASLPYGDVVVWDNSDPAREDVGIMGRYAALAECTHDTVFFQDDDVLFTAHDALLAEYEPGVLVCNMDGPWVEACGYHDLGMLGAGSICDKSLLQPALDRYLAAHPSDAELLQLQADFAVGTIVPHRKVDLGYTAREFADAPDRLYRQSGQTAAKERVRAKARLVRDGAAVAA